MLSSQSQHSRLSFYDSNFVPVRPQFFICWITFHFKEFQSAVIGKKIKIKIELGPKMYQLFVLLSKQFFVSDTQCNFRHIIYTLTSNKYLGKINPHRIFGMIWYHVILLSLAATWVFFFFFFLNVQNQSSAGNVIQLNKKISLIKKDLGPCLWFIVRLVSIWHATMCHELKVDSCHNLWNDVQLQWLFWAVRYISFKIKMW